MKTEQTTALEAVNFGIKQNALNDVNVEKCSTLLQKSQDVNQFQIELVNLLKNPTELQERQLRIFAETTYNRYQELKHQTV
jgi:hypothetical protein